MADETEEYATLNPSRRRRPSPVWLIPLATALIGLWLVYQNIVSRGPQITLAIDTAEGLEAGKTAVKVRSVEVGRVTGIRLADDYNGAVARVQMNPDTDDLLVADSEFWVVKPRVGRQGISGLGTILSGAYIQLRPGDAERAQRRFTVLDEPPARSRDEPGILVTLTSDGDNSLAIGDPLIYQGQTVGQIESAEFAPANKRMEYGVFVQQPFARLIADNTQFWLRSGIDFHLGSDGVDVQTGSIQSVLAGGVTFGLPKGVEGDAAADNGDVFKLYTTRNAAMQDRFSEKIHYVILLDDSVRGLNEGAPVEYRGLRVGTVEQVPFFRDDFDLRRFSDFKIPVLIALEPERPANRWTDWSENEWRQNNRRFFANGLRATIKSGNLLTGSTFINLQFDAGATRYEPQKIGGYAVFPSQPSQITSIQTQLSELMDKLNALDIRPIAQDLQQTLDRSNATLAELHRATRNINQLLETESARELPRALKVTLAELQQTLTGFQQGAPAYGTFNRTLERLNRVLDDVAPLARTLRNDPNALIFGPATGRDPIPRAAR